MILDVIIVVVAVFVGGYLAFSRRLSGSSAWRATVTPLASIMGSGFLISAPLLGGIVGFWAVGCMLVLLVIAYGVGEVMRFNIRHFERVEYERGGAQRVAFVSRVVLAGAYFISVTYYLQLLAAFVLSGFGVESELVANWVTTGILLGIGVIGMWRGLGLLEGVEKYAVALNLGMIAALLVGLLVYNGELLLGGEWRLPEVESVIDWGDFRVLLGLLIVVQGFETSRYLGEEHSAEERVRTMRWAQWIASGIYVLFIGLATVLFVPGMGVDVTAIIRICAPVAVVLPLLLTLAAVGSQFSAAVADDEGAGGLLKDISGGRLGMRWAYLVILVVTVGLTWLTDVNEIISYASRAFALFYGMQCGVAFLMVRRSGGGVGRLGLFGVLGAVCLVVFLVGMPAE